MPAIISQVSATDRHLKPAVFQPFTHGKVIETVRGIGHQNGQDEDAHREEDVPAERSIGIAHGPRLMLPILRPRRYSSLLMASFMVSLLKVKTWLRIPNDKVVVSPSMRTLPTLQTT